ncbi:hypothetical protein KM043_001967 [Ampulex compressa]|nr:hypothetical protein KM043_001967 [Ampulex compressa]
MAHLRSGSNGEKAVLSAWPQFSIGGRMIRGRDIRGTAAMGLRDPAYETRFRRSAVKQPRRIAFAEGDPGGSLLRAISKKRVSIRFGLVPSFSPRPGTETTSEDSSGPVCAMRDSLGPADFFALTDRDQKDSGFRLAGSDLSRQ